MQQDELAGRIEALETRLAFQDRTIEELNGVITEQWREIDALKRQLGLLEEMLRETQAALPDSGPEPPPPHY
jgi:SlyX protein